MSMSVIVPAYNAAATLERCLNAIRAAAPPDADIIVADDGSADGTAALAERLGVRVLRGERRQGAAAARQRGAVAARGEVLAFVDADVVIFPDTLRTVASYFETHPEVAAVTGLFSTEHPNANFWSQYKNLYMNFVFRRTPEKATFLFGSIFAVRAAVVAHMPQSVFFVEDTAFGQALVQRGHDVRLLKNLEVIHLKRYSFGTWVRNDFRVPFRWGLLFSGGAWRLVGRAGTGFAHASRTQLMSLLLATASVIVFFVAPALAAAPAALWYLLNAPFFWFLARHRGAAFALAAVPVTLFDHVIMALGAATGVAAGTARR